MQNTLLFSFGKQGQRKYMEKFHILYPFVWNFPVKTCMLFTASLKLSLFEAIFIFKDIFHSFEYISISFKDIFYSFKARRRQFKQLRKNLKVKPLSQTIFFKLESFWLWVSSCKDVCKHVNFGARKIVAISGIEPATFRS